MAKSSLLKMGMYTYTVAAADLGTASNTDINAAADMC